VRYTRKGRELGPRETAKWMEVDSVDPSNHPSHEELRMSECIHSRRSWTILTKTTIKERILARERLPMSTESLGSVLRCVKNPIMKNNGWLFGEVPEDRAKCAFYYTFFSSVAPCVMQQDLLDSLQGPCLDMGSCSSLPVELS
jgi:hypothetical protein